jgi:hypothetical protein
MTAAPPGQGGHFHVNEQPSEYWIKQFETFGYQVDPKTKSLVVKLVDKGRNLKTVPRILRHPEISHDGVWIPEWMPSNLLIFGKTSAL